MESSEWMSQWESMTNDELFALREQMQEILNAKLLAKKVTLERRLRTLSELSGNGSAAKPRAVKRANHVQRAER
jgi:hypothetical protein